MPRYQLDLRVDLPAAGGDPLGDALTEASHQVRTQIYQQLGLKVYSHSWVTIRLDSGRGQRTLQRLQDGCRAAGAVVGTATVSERIGPDDVASADWFLLATKMVDTFSLWDDYPSYLPGKLGKDHALNHTFVSAAFVEACRKAGLTGLSFLRCRNRGRKPGPPWFVALPDHSLGRGLDHPWFDRARWVRDVGSDRHKRSSSVEEGQHAFRQRWVKEDLARGDPTIAPLLGLTPASAAERSTLTGLTFVMIPRYWAGAFPSTDFAYVPWGEDGPNREGKMLRFRQLMIGRRARAALIGAGLLAEKALLPVRSVAQPEPGVVLLDQLYPPVPPMYTAEELAALRSREA